ncbi:MAG: hypothetical protein ACE5EA_06430 [Nitrospirota bacterium]
MNIKKIWVYFSLLLVSIFVSVISFTPDIYAADIAVIANKDYPADSITVGQLKNIYLGEKRIESGVKINPINQQDANEIKILFIKKVFSGLSVESYHQYWIGKLFRDGITPPKKEDSSENVIKRVSSEKGSMGYVWVNEAQRVKSIKILTVIRGN